MGSHDSTAEASPDAVNQSFEILLEKLKQKTEANLHPLAISQPVAFSEEMLSKFDWSPTARIYLHAFKLVKEGFEILHKSDFTDEKGISLIALGFLTENSILQAFPKKNFVWKMIFQLCEKNLQNNPNYFEGLLLSYALQHFGGKISLERSKVDTRKIMCLLNLIHFIQNTEPNHLPHENPCKFDENYSSWLHVLYEHLGSFYVIGEDNKKAAEAFENSLKCCPSYLSAKRGLGYALLSLYSERNAKRYDHDASLDVPKDLMPDQEKGSDRVISKYISWTTKKLRDTATKVLKEYITEAPPCHKTYPNAYYYLAWFSFQDEKMDEFKKYYELAQDAEEKRLPFLEPVDFYLKDWMAPIYQLLPNVQKRLAARCGNKACTKKVKESELKFCARCGKQKYCSK